jgi:hypothetical protein
MFWCGTSRDRGQGLVITVVLLPNVPVKGSQYLPETLQNENHKISTLDHASFKKYLLYFHVDGVI